jgi:hypothetical protein
MGAKCRNYYVPTSPNVDLRGDLLSQVCLVKDFLHNRCCTLASKADANEDIFSATVLQVKEEAYHHG